jgi:hypothetical protein
LPPDHHINYHAAVVGRAHAQPGARACRVEPYCLLLDCGQRGDITDANPAVIDVALPAGSRRPAVIAPVAWHLFNQETFEIGRETLPVDAGLKIGIYNAQRSIIDAFRLRHREGDDLAYTALRRWVRQPGNSPATLHEMARRFPRTLKPITNALEILQYDDQGPTA